MGFGHYTACARDWMDMYTDCGAGADNTSTASSTSGTGTGRTGTGASGAWYKYDDEDVTPVRDEREILSPAAYLLFYRRRPASQY